MSVFQAIAAVVGVFVTYYTLICLIIVVFMLPKQHKV